MGKINVHAGDFIKGKDSQFMNGAFLMATGKGMLAPKWETYRAAQVEALEVASEENVKRLGGTLGWGAVGALALGPVGLLAGALVGGRKKEVTFVIKFKDGKKALATTDSKNWTKMQAALF